MYKLEGHKLHLHPERIFNWCEGKNIAPVYVEVGPTSVCNHRCQMCAYDYLQHEPHSINPKRLVSLVEELSETGVKSICFAGDGEPLLNTGTVDAICKAHNLGVDTAISTNGVLCTEDVLRKILPALTWIRFSVNGGNQIDYTKIHKSKEDDFLKVKENLRSASFIKAELNLDVALGVQYVLLPENIASVYDAACLAKEAGVDYFVVKPFYQNVDNQYESNGFNMSDHQQILNNVESLSTEVFHSSVRWESDSTNISLRRYSECFGLSFISIISASGDVFPCLPHQNMEKSFGNINSSSFSEIWNGDQRQSVLSIMKNHDKNTCQPNCRQHWINEFLWDIKNQPAHANFI